MALAAKAISGAPAADTSVAGVPSWWSGTLPTMVRRNAISLLDQAVVSGTRFFTTVLIGRACGQGELGAYSLGFTLVLVIACIQESLVCVPYTIFGNRLPGGARNRLAGSSLVFQGLLTLLVMACLGTLGVLVDIGVGPQSLSPVIWILTAMIPVMLLRDFARRFAFAHLHTLQALALDVVVSVVQIGGLVWLASRGSLTAGSAYMVIGLACGVGAVGSLAVAHSQFVVRWDAVPSDVRKNWSLGRWIMAEQLTAALHTPVVFWTLTLLLGTTATGAFAACLSVAMLANPFVLGVANVLTPQTAKAFAEGGAPAVLGVVRDATLFLAGGIGLFLVFLVLFGDLVVTSLFGPEYSGHGPVVGVIGLSVVAWASGIAMDIGLRVIERPDVNVMASLIGLAVVLVTALSLVGPLGLFGAALSMLFGVVAALSVQCIVFLRLAGTFPEAAA